MKLKHWMQETGTTQQQIASAIGLNRASISRLENGKAFPEWATVHAIRVFTRNRVKERDWYEQWKEGQP